MAMMRAPVGPGEAGDPGAIPPMTVPGGRGRVPAAQALARLAQAIRSNRKATAGWAGRP